MRLTRCYVATPLTTGATLVLPAAVSAHIARVLRLRAGATLTLFDGRGGEFEAAIRAVVREGVSVHVGAHVPTERESPVMVTLLQCLARGERMDFIVQKATELGVTQIVPVHSEHGMVRLEGAAYSVWTRWAGLDLVIRIGASTVTIVGRNGAARTGSPWRSEPANRAAATACQRSCRSRRLSRPAPRRPWLRAACCSSLRRHARWPPWSRRQGWRPLAQYSSCWSALRAA